MSVRIRLARFGRKKAPYYRLVVADSRFPRDGRFIEILGLYHPLEKEEEKQVRIDEERALVWLREGAQPSDTCRSLLRRQGILKKFHEEKVAIRKEKQAAKAQPES